MSTINRDSSTLESAGSGAAARDYSCEVPVLNSSQLLDRCLGNIDLADRVLTRFVDTMPRELSEFEQAIAAGNGEQVRATAHRLKGAAANIAATRLESRLQALEGVAAQSRLEDATTLLEELGAELRRLADESPPWRNDTSHT